MRSTYFVTGVKLQGQMIMLLNGSCLHKVLMPNIKQNRSHYVGLREHASKDLNLLKKRLQHRRFPVIFVKCLRTPLLQNTSM